MNMTMAMTKNELISMLSEIEGNPEIIIYCANNHFDIGYAVENESTIVLVVGEAANFKLESPDYIIK